MGRIVKYKIPEVIVADFETAGIKRRPDYPPKPVGISLIMPGEKKSTYYGWGHPTKNNCTEAQGYAQVRKAWALARSKKIPLLFQNGKFDIDVAEVHCGVPRLDWSLYHDTMYLIFLHDPHAETYSLKPAAERILGMPPEEQDIVKEWVLAHRQEISSKYGLDKLFALSEWGAYICEAPGDIVGKYADGDTVRTLKLFNHLLPDIWARDMMQAYDRERRLMPILLENERQGMRVDRKTLGRDIEIYEVAKEKTDAALRKRLKTPGLNVDSDAEVATALKKSGIVTNFVLTPTGKDSVSKKNLTIDLFTDPEVFRMLGYRNRLTTCLSMFMRRWYLISAKTGYINTSWNQVRQSRAGGNNNGTRTGRPSTVEPNFLNLSKDWYDKGDGYEHPLKLDVPKLPLVRQYILPDTGGVFLHRDYNQQELRLLAHFENNLLMEEYARNPRMDIHQFVADLIEQITGIKLSRRETKIINFGLLYGMGLGKLSDSLETDVLQTKRIKQGQMAALPGLKQLQADINALAKGGDPIRTFGGREYYPEPPRKIGGRLVDFIYKLLNYLIQGSAADVTKEAIIRHDEIKRESRFLVSVYDEINISAPKGAYKREMALLREAMEGIEGIDVPMLSDGKSGPNWGALASYKD